jgi:adenylate kinase family enzyme
MPVAKRILILGPSGAGKSTLARRIGTRLALPVVHLDTFHWNPGWIESEAARFRERLAEAVAGDAWVMDGNYTSHLDLRLPRTEAVISTCRAMSIFRVRCGVRCGTTGANVTTLVPAAPSNSTCRS